LINAIAVAQRHHHSSDLNTPPWTHPPLARPYLLHCWEMGMAPRSDVTFFIDGGFCTLTEYVGIILIKHAGLYLASNAVHKRVANGER
jgi:hypothetical protein